MILLPLSEPKPPGPRLVPCALERRRTLRMVITNTLAQWEHDMEGAEQNLAKAIDSGDQLDVDLYTDAVLGLREGICHLRAELAQMEVTPS